MAEEFIIRGILDVTDAEAQLRRLRVNIAALNRANSAGFQSAAGAANVLQQQLNLVQNNIGQINNIHLRQFQSNVNGLNIKIRQLGFALERLGIRGAAAGGELIGAFGAAGLAIGAVGLAVVALTAGMVTLAATGVGALKKLAVASFETGKEIQNAKAQFTAFFEGNEQAANAVIERTLAFAAETGISNASELSRAFLPLVDNLDQLDKILEIGAGLQAFQPEQSSFLRQTLQDLLAGQTRSVVQRFELPREEAEKFREAFDTEGIAAGLQVIDDFLKDSGRSIENFADTATLSVGKITARYQILQKIVGEPLTAAITEELQGVVKFIDDNDEAIRDFGANFGIALGESVGDLGGLFENVLDEIVEALPTISGTLDLFAVTIDQFSRLAGSRNELNVISIIFGIISDQLLRVNRLLNAANIAWTGLTGTIAVAIVSLTSLQKLLSGQITLEQFETDVFDIAKRQADRLHESIFSLSDAYEEIGEKNRAYNDELNAGTALGEIAVNQFLAQRSAAKDAADALEEIAEAQGKVNEAVDKFNVDVKRDRFDQKQKEQRREEDLDEEFARKREDLERDHQLKIVDISNDFFFDRIDSITDFTRKEEDILRKAGRRTVDLEAELAKDRIKIEEDLQSELDKINRRFDLSRREAIRDNDAVAFVRNEERRNFALNEARIAAEEERNEAAQAAVEKREALKTQLDREIEDAEIANRRKLEDLLETLRREINAEAERYDLALQEQDTYEKRKAESQKLDAEREREDLQKAWDRRIEDLNTRFAEELALISQLQNQQYQIVLDHQRRMAALTASGFAGGAALGGIGAGGSGSGFDFGNVGGASGGGKTLEDLRQLAQRLAVERQRLDLLPVIEEAAAQTLKNIIASLGGDPSTAGTPRANGGPIFANKNYLFEGREPEVVSFGQHGRVTPMRMIPNGIFGGSGGGNVTNNDIRVEQSMLDPNSFPPAQRAIIEQMIIRVMKDALSR